MNRQWLINLRRQKGFTQSHLGECLGVSRPYITQMERGTRSPSVVVAKRYGEVLGFDWVELFAPICSELKHQ